MSTSRSTPTPEFPEPQIDAPSQRRLPVLLRRAWYGLNQAFRRRVAHLDLTPDQFTVLRWLHEDETGGMTQRTLTDLMASDPNTVTSVLTRMEAGGMIERRPHEKDRRAKRIRLKPKGKRIYTEARQIAIELQQQLLSVFPEGRREPFLEELQLLADAARDAAEHSPGSHNPSGATRS